MIYTGPANFNPLLNIQLHGSVTVVRRPKDVNCELKHNILSNKDNFLKRFLINNGRRFHKNIINSAHRFCMNRIKRRENRRIFV